MLLQQLFAVLRARWLIALAVFLVGVTAVTAYTLTMPKSYIASASVVVDVKPDPIAGTALAMAPTYMTTQIDVINSRKVALKVVEDLKINAVPEMRTRWQTATGGVGDFNTWVADSIRGGLNAVPSRGSSVIRITYEAGDPAFAATMANAFVRGYLAVTMDLRTDPAKQFSEFFKANGQQLRDRLEEAQNKLSDYQRKQDLVITDERLDFETSKLAELSQLLLSAQSAAVDSVTRQTAANSQGEKSQDVMASPLVASLKSDLVRQEAALEQMRTRLGDQHPQVQEALTGVSNIRAKYEAEIRRTTASLGVNNNVNVSRVNQIRAQLEAQREKVFELKASRDAAALLQKDVDSARAAYDSVLSRLNMTSLESQAVLPNVAALEQATPPGGPNSPRTRSNILVGALASLVLALAVVMVVERFDRRLRTRSDMEVLLDLPSLGQVPSFTKIKGDAALPDRFRLSAPPTVPAALGR